MIFSTFRVTGINSRLPSMHACDNFSVSTSMISFEFSRCLSLLFILMFQRNTSLKVLLSLMEVCRSYLDCPFYAGRATTRDGYGANNGTHCFEKHHLLL